MTPPGNAAAHLEPRQVAGELEAYDRNAAATSTTVSRLVVGGWFSNEVFTVRTIRVTIPGDEELDK
jgi:hypothetical protein